MQGATACVGWGSGEDAIEALAGEGGGGDRLFRRLSPSRRASAPPPLAGVVSCVAVCCVCVTFCDVEPLFLQHLRAALLLPLAELQRVALVEEANERADAELRQRHRRLGHEGHAHPHCTRSDATALLPAAAPCVASPAEFEWAIETERRIRESQLKSKQRFFGSK